MTIRTAMLLSLVLLPASIAHAQGTALTTSSTVPGARASAAQNDDLLSLDLNDLMNVKVTTVSKSAESFNKVAASLYVVTAEDIRRSGAQNIPEALRLVPGVEVAQLNSGQYAVTIRGFNSGFSDKLLVLIDGRSIYNDLFGGVFWEDQQLPMADIDRIEVVKGPGTATWGANAVQGIINIITKSAKETQGLATTAEYGDKVDQDQETIRYGASFGKDGYYRVFGMSTDRNAGLVAEGDRARDSRIDRNAGFRLDEGSEEAGKLQVSGDIFRNVSDALSSQETVPPPWLTTIATNYADSGGDLLGHYEKLQANGSTVSLQASAASNIHYIQPLLRDDSNTVSIDLQDSLAQHGAHSIILGLGFKDEGSKINGLTFFGTPNSSKTQETTSGFVQDQIALSKTVTAQIGSKVENNNFTGWEYEPSAHLGYSPNSQHTLWTSASRAVRIPTLQDMGFPLVTAVLPYPYGGSYVPLSVFLHPAAKNDSEIVAAYEAGYRVQATQAVLLDFSAFYNNYSQLLGQKAYDPIVLTAGPPAGIIAPFSLSDIGSGHSSGGEIVSHVRLSPDWRVNFGYSYVHAVIPPSLYASLFDTPQSETKIQSYYNINKKTELDSSVYFVARNPQEDIGSYTKLDIRLGYNPTKKIEISVGGNNLLQNNYAQFGLSTPLTTYDVEREFYTKISWKY